MRVNELIAAGIVEDELAAFDMVPIEYLEDFGGCGFPDDDLLFCLGSREWCDD